MLYLLQNTIASSIRPMRQSLRIVRATLNSASNPFINTEIHKSNLAWLDVIVPFRRKEKAIAWMALQGNISIQVFR